jgi:hypothetical protein
MPDSCHRPDDFVVVDPFQRRLRFFVHKTKFFRRDESVVPLATDADPVKEVSKMVYALQWLDLCLAEGVVCHAANFCPTCGRQMFLQDTCTACSNGE